MDKREFEEKLLKFRFNLKHRINLYKKLKKYVESGFPVYESLLKFKARFEKKKDYRAKIIGIWADNIAHGDKLATALQGWVPDSELNLIAAGEDGAGVETGLGEAIKFSESSQRIKKTIINGGTYPVVLTLIVLGFIAMFSIKLAPTYLSLLPVESWPELGRNFYFFSKFLVDYWYILLAFVLVGGFIIAVTMPTWTGTLREKFDKLPPWSIYKVYHSSSFLISLASLMKSGTPINDALKRMKKISPAWLEQYLDMMLGNMKKAGGNFGNHLDVGLLDEETAGDVIDYSALGSFEEAVYQIGTDNLDESVEKIEQRMALVRNLMIVLVGITVGVIYYTTIELNSTVAEAASSSTMSTIRR